jgi:two-component system, OmpR family, alkaline phosphatase synthesis response regulator PhoP
MMKRVLVVDDDLDVSLLVRKVGESAGAQISVAPNGREALRMAIRDKPDLIFLDIMMPGMDGVMVLAELRRRPELNGTKVVMLTAKSSRKDAVETHNIGADDYIVKPFTTKQILDRIILG